MIGIIIQARMTSRRFPGKVAAMLRGKPVLSHVIAACKQSIEADTVVVACPESAKSEPIRRICMAETTRLIEGPEDDVLARYTIAAIQLNLDHIIRITADCPFTDPHLIDEVSLFLREGKLDYCSNVFPWRTYPKGMDVEAFTIDTLLRTRDNARSMYDREHVTPYMQRSSTFKRGTISQKRNQGHIDLCVDVPNDIRRLERWYDWPLECALG